MDGGTIPSPGQPGGEAAADPLGPGPSTQEESYPSAIETLPDELVLAILQYVPVADLVVRVPLTCRRWYRLARDPALWRRQTLHYRHCASDSDFMSSLMRAPRLDKLDLTGLQAGSASERTLGRSVMRSVLSVLPYRAPRSSTIQPLRKLVLSDEMDCTVAMLLVEMLLPNLEVLHIGRMSMKKESYTDLMRLVDQSRLRELKVAASVRFREYSELHGFNHYQSSERSLQRLEVWSEDDMPVNAICRLIRAHCDSLRYFSHEFMSNKPGEAQERRVMDAIGLCRNLEGVRVWSSKRLVRVLSGCESVSQLTLTCDGDCRSDALNDTYACLELFEKSPVLPRLRSLCLRFMECPSVQPLAFIAARCPDIEELTLHCSTTDRKFNEHLLVLKKLRHLTLIGAHYLHPDTVRAWTELMLPDLKRLNLIGTARFCPWVCWAGAIKELRARRPELVVLLRECEHFKSSASASSTE